MIPLKSPSVFRILLVALACLVSGGALFGLGYWQGERTTRQEMTALAAKQVNPGPGNNFPRFGAGPSMPFMPRQTNIPPNASPEMKEFLQNQQTLQEKFAQLRSQNTNCTPYPQLYAEFQQQNADLLKRQRELGQIIAQQRAKEPLQEPPPLQIPPNASPQLRAYLTARDQLMRDRIAFMNQHRTDDPATRQAAMQQWQQQNATRFQQLQQLAQAMAQNTNTVNKATTTN
jgi:hypothetical protein